MVRSFSSGGITRQRAQQPPAKTSVAQDQSLQDWAACFKAAMSTFVVSEVRHSLYYQNGEIH